MVSSANHLALFSLPDVATAALFRHFAWAPALVKTMKLTSSMTTLGIFASKAKL